MDEKKLNLFFEHYGIAFWVLYLLFPFFLRRAMPMPLYALLYLGLLGAYVTAMQSAYRSFTTKRNFILDAAILSVGVILLNWFVFYGPIKSTALDLTAYSILAFSFAPTAFRLEHYKRGMVF